MSSFTTIPIKQHITAEKAQQMLQAGGMVVTIDEAKAVVNYLYSAALNILSNEESNSIHQG
ncbi:hypothetical protein ACFOWM_03305 [Ferruginibacter yonginensis]|uniref:Uncharacterized protein n=1 Tax=Ferruginibacter yonginensis TaxID=1310416 RepID=A0ABV8QNN8_9BACT